MTFAESSPKTGYVIFFMNIVKCQQNCICCGCRYVFFCIMGIWKVTARASCCYSLEKSSKICGGRSLKAGRGRQGRPNNAQARPNTHHLPPQYSVHVFTQITNSLLKSTLHSSKGGGWSKFTKKCNVWDYKESWGGVTTSSHECFLIIVWPPSECKRTKYYNMESSRIDEISIAPPSNGCNWISLKICRGQCLKGFPNWNVSGCKWVWGTDYQCPV